MIRSQIVKPECKVQKRHRRLPLCEAWGSRRVHIHYPQTDPSGEESAMVYHNENQAETLLSLWIVSLDEGGVYDSLNLN